MRLALLLAALSLAGPAAAASFDCTKATSPDEAAVCANPKLSALDVLVDRAYGEARRGYGGAPDPADRAHALDDARDFNARKRRCGADLGCLTAAHAGALEDFLAYGSSVQVPAWVSATSMTPSVPVETRALPAREGACARTRVAAVGGRLEGDPDFSSGTTVSFANGGAQVSYDRVPAIVASRRGDPVLMCLTSIPKHCPPGDDRGRSYTSTNLRTHASWSLGDSQHRCGGA